jgi:RNA polymerase sigma-70 factor (ECF subfamily)
MSTLSQSSSSSFTLLVRVRAKDPDAWQRLVRLYAPLVYEWARRAGLQSSDAADVGQEVFRTVVDSIENYQGNGSGDAFRAWLWGITRNKLHEFYRRMASQPIGAGGTDANLQLQQTAEVQLPEDSAVFGDQRPALIQRALQLIQVEFEPRTLQAFWQATVEGRQTADIAADLEMTIKAVRQAKYRVMRRLRQELDELL